MARYTQWCDRAREQILRNGEMTSRTLMYNIAQSGFSQKRSPTSVRSASQALLRDNRFTSHEPDIGEYQFGDGEVARGYHYKIKLWSVIR
jgi:hypothetical protein